MPVRNVIERGPEGKRSAPFSIDRAGWSRGARTPELARETLESCPERDRQVANLADLAAEFDAANPLEVVEDQVGAGSVDFCGISFSACSAERSWTLPFLIRHPAHHTLDHAWEIEGKDLLGFTPAHRVRP